MDERGAVSHPDSSTARLRVLLAEDDSDMRDLLGSALREDGHGVLAVGDGVELLAALWRLCLANKAPDLVVSDVRMPGCSGLEVFEAARRASSRPIPVILVTGFGDRALHERARRLGAIAVFDKPFDLDTLSRFVADFASGSADSQRRTSPC
jgi:CheY-like chemotaxis protein